MADTIWRIRRDYRAVHHSGTRKTSSIAYFVVHAAEAPLPETGAESVGRYFQSPTSRGSTQYGVDINSTQQYLSDNYIAWGAPPLNVSGLHVECAGNTANGRGKWLIDYGPMFKRLGWLIHIKTKKYGIPMEVLSVAQLKDRGTLPAKGKGGIVFHSTVSLAWHQSDHTDPGDGFPMDVVMAWAHKYRKKGRLGNLGKPILHVGCKSKWVTRLQNDLTSLGFYTGKVDGHFGKATEAAVKKLQKKYHLKPSGVVNDNVWKVCEK